MKPVDNKPCPPNRLRQLRAFCLAAQTGNISRAAERLCSSQPAVSQLIMSLESDLGIMLFERRGPRIQLTDDGQAFFDIALPILEELDNLPAALAERLGEITAGTLDIAAGESTILYLLPEYVYRFSIEYPLVELRLHNVTGRDGLAMLRNGEVDLAVGSMIDIPHDISYVPTFNYDPMLITSLEHPLAGRKEVTLEEVSECGLILPPRHLSTWHIVDLVFRQHGLNYKVVLEAGGWEIIKRYVALGMGVSIVTSICLTGEESLAAIPLTQYFPRRSYGIVLRRNKQLSPQARRFVEILDPDFFDHPDHSVSGQPGPSHQGRRPSQDGLVGHDEALT
ncbi:MAG: LysR family transcriptional regulator [Gammaproteobacteria bacterium]|nr:LysR family transcriptional regulator [Gammaproteobacteria bacterium]